MSRTEGGAESRKGQVLVAPHREWEVMERELERRTPRGLQLSPLGFGSGGYITALATDNPRGGYLFEYTSPTRPLNGGHEYDPGRTADEPEARTPTSVVGVTGDGYALFLDQNTAAVGAWDISGLRLRIVARLDSVPVVQTACAPDTRTIAFLESSHPGSIRFRSLEGLGDRQIDIRSGLVDSSHAPWTTATLTGLMGAGCALWAPSWSDVIPVTDSAVGRPWTLRWSSPRVSPFSRVIKWFRGFPPSAITRDVTVFPGGIAVLPADGKAIDLYSFHGGHYLETLVLPRPALRIAGAPDRLFVLSQAQDTILLASYVLPQNARELTPPGWHQERGDRPAPPWLGRVRAPRR
jgi:hypothetical protein